MIIGKIIIKQDNYDCLIFCVRDIKHIQIPNFIKHICSSSFDHCEQLEEIHIPSDSKLETIEEPAFCSSMIKRITIPSLVVSVKVVPIVFIFVRSISDKFFSTSINTVKFIIFDSGRMMSASFEMSLITISLMHVSFLCNKK